MSDPNVLGHFVWHELMTTDTQSAGAFYSKITGWTTQPAPHDPSYTTFMADGLAVAGLMILPEQARQMGAPPNWLTYIATPDVDKTVQKSNGLGGKVLLAARDIPNIGRFAVLADPQGASFAVISMTQNPPVSEALPPIGDFSWHELATTDAVAAWKFYSQLFGWKATESMDMGPMGTYQMFGPMTRSVGGIYTKPKEMPGPAAWLPYIKAKDSKDVSTRVPGLGGKIINGPMEVPGGDWIVVGLDPQGATFATHSVTPKAAAQAPAAARKAPAAKTAARKTAKPAARKAAKPAARTAKKAKSTKAARPAVKKKAAKKTARPAARKRSASKGRARKAVKKTAAKK